MSEQILRAPGPSLLDTEAAAPAVAPVRASLSLGQNLALGWEVVLTGLTELWSHKIRSMLTLTLLTLGVFALVVMTSVMDGVSDKIGTAFSGMAWDGTVMIVPKAPETTEEAKRFAMSPGLRFEDLSRIAAPHPKVLAFVPKARRTLPVRIASGMERVFVSGVTADYFPVMNRQIASGRALTEDDSRRRQAVAVVGATLATRLAGGADPLGRDVVLQGISFRIVGVLAPRGIVNDDDYCDANGFVIPLEAYMDRIDATHALEKVQAKLTHSRHMQEVQSALLARARQAHHGIADVEVMDMDQELAKATQQFQDQIHGWRVVLTSLASTVLLVGGVGVLSVMLISLSDRRFEIGLRKSLGATDRQIFVQFLLEALVLAALGAFVGTLAGAGMCKALSASFPYGLVVNTLGLLSAWGVALGLSLLFGLYPAFRAMRLSPMEAMR